MRTAQGFFSTPFCYIIDYGYEDKYSPKAGRPEKSRQAQSCEV